MTIINFDVAVSGAVLVDVDGEVLFAYIWIMTNLGWMFQVKNGGIGKQTIFKKTC